MQTENVCRKGKLKIIVPENVKVNCKSLQGAEFGFAETLGRIWTPKDSERWECWEKRWDVGRISTPGIQI